MASNVSPRPPKASPLSFMTEVSPYVSTHRPAGTEDDPASPKLVILLGWMDANPAHLAKYVRGYQSLYPSAQILLVRSEMKHVLWRPSRITPDVRPAVPIIRAAIGIDAASKTTPLVLIHTWSNGGSSMLAHLRAAYGDNFPLHVMIFDSAPALYTHAHGLAACTIGMPTMMKLASYPFLIIASVLYVAWYLGRDNAFTRWYLSHNDAKGELRRTYIYSDTDTLTPSRDVEQHAEDAKKKGYQVRMEQFKGTGHIAHMRGDEERYWNIVTETWEGN